MHHPLVEKRAAKLPEMAEHIGRIVFATVEEALRRQYPVVLPPPADLGLEARPWGHWPYILGVVGEDNWNRNNTTVMITKTGETAANTPFSLEVLADVLLANYRPL